MPIPKNGPDRAWPHKVPRVLIAIPTETHGGCEYNAITFGADLAKNFECDVWATFPYNETLSYVADLVRLNGMEYLPMDCEFLRSDDARKVKNQEVALWSILESLRPDIVFIPLPWPKRGQGLISGVAATGIPSLVKFALVPEEWSDSEFVNEGTRNAQNQNQTWFANSDYSSRLLEKHYRLQPFSVDAMHVGPIGLNRLKQPVDTANEALPKVLSREARLGLEDLKASDVVLTTVARLSVQKGYSYLLDAAIELIAENPNLRFVWVGDGDLQAALEEKIAAHGLGAHFSLLGFRKDVREILQASDIFVLPTVYEGGCSQALLEAMEEKLPVIVSDTSAVAEVITHRENGLLAQTCSADDIKQQISVALADKTLCKTLVENASETVKLFSAEVMFAETRMRLENLLHHRFRPRNKSSAKIKQQLPSATLEQNDIELFVDFGKSKFLFGFKLSRATQMASDRIWMQSSGMINIEDPRLFKCSGVFFAGTMPESDAKASDLKVLINRIPLELKFRQSGSEWSAFAKMPADAVGHTEQGAMMEFRMPESASSGAGAQTISIRKIAFPLKPETQPASSE